jgi:hypothetical protein
MIRAILLALLLSTSVLAAGVPGSPTGTVTSAETANVKSPVTTINGQCTTPATGCAAGQFVSIKLGGRNSVTAHIIPSNFTGTLTPYVSMDEGVTWNLAAQRSTSSNFTVLGPAAQGTGLAASSAVQDWPITFAYRGVTDVMLASTAAVTNTATVQLIASNAVDNPFPLAATGKGLQPLGGGAIGTQDLKDSGRSYVVFSADGVTPAIAETVITFTKIVADTSTAAQTSYTITSGKTLRIQAVCASMTAGATANRIRVALRLNTGGACVAGSKILLPVVELAPNYGTATAAEGGASACFPIPDGLEIAGNGTKAICLSENATAASGTLTVGLIANEY